MLRFAAPGLLLAAALCLLLPHWAHAPRGGSAAENAQIDILSLSLER